MKQHTAGASKFQMNSNASLLAGKKYFAIYSTSILQKITAARKNFLGSNCGDSLETEVRVWTFKINARISSRVGAVCEKLRIDAPVAQLDRASAF